MDKSSTEYEDQSDWSDYVGSEEISEYLLDTDTDNESYGSEIFPRKRNRVFHVQFLIIKSYRKGLSKHRAKNLQKKIRGLNTFVTVMFGYNIVSIVVTNNVLTYN